MIRVVEIDSCAVKQSAIFISYEPTVLVLLDKRPREVLRADAFHFAARAKHGKLWMVGERADRVGKISHVACYLEIFMAVRAGVVGNKSEISLPSMFNMTNRAVVELGDVLRAGKTIVIVGGVVSVTVLARCNTDRAMHVVPSRDSLDRLESLIVTLRAIIFKKPMRIRDTMRPVDLFADAEMEGKNTNGGKRYSRPRRATPPPPPAVRPPMELDVHATGNRFIGAMICHVVRSGQLIPSRRDGMPNREDQQSERQRNVYKQPSVQESMQPGLSQQLPPFVTGTF